MHRLGCDAAAVMIMPTYWLCRTCSRQQVHNMSGADRCVLTACAPCVSRISQSGLAFTNVSRQSLAKRICCMLLHVEFETHLHTCMLCAQVTCWQYCFLHCCAVLCCAVLCCAGLGWAVVGCQQLYSHVTCPVVSAADACLCCCRGSNTAGAVCPGTCAQLFPHLPPFLTLKALNTFSLSCPLLYFRMSMHLTSTFVTGGICVAAEAAKELAHFPLEAVTTSCYYPPANFG